MSITKAIIQSLNKKHLNKHQVYKKTIIMEGLCRKLNYKEPSQGNIMEGSQYLGLERKWCLNYSKKIFMKILNTRALCMDLHNWLEV